LPFGSAPLANILPTSSVCASFGFLRLFVYVIWGRGFVGLRRFDKWEAIRIASAYTLMKAQSDFKTN